MSKSQRPDTTQAVLKALATSGLEDAAAEPPDAAGLSLAHGSAWHKLSIPGFADLQDIEVKVPVSAKVRLDRDGEVQGVELEPPTEESLEEVVSFVRGLAKRGEIAGRSDDGSSLRRPTHQLVTDERGTSRLVRRGVSS